jgi:hypothetical protein
VVIVTSIGVGSVTDRRESSGRSTVFPTKEPVDDAADRIDARSGRVQ